MGRLILKIFKMDHPFTIYNHIDKKNNNCGSLTVRSCFSLKIYSIECSTNPRIEIRAVWSRICDLVLSIDNNKEKSIFYADPKNFPSQPRISRFPRRSFGKMTLKSKFTAIAVLLFNFAFSTPYTSHSDGHYPLPGIFYRPR